MKLSIENIRNMLPDSARSICHRPTAKILGLKKFTPDITAPNLEYLYLDEHAGLNEFNSVTQGNFLVHSPDDFPDESVGTNCNLFVIKNLEDYIDLITRISDQLSVYSKLDDIADTIVDIIRLGGDVQSVMKYAYELLNNPLMLVDVSFNLIAHVGTSALNNEDAWDYAIKNKVFSADYINHVISNSSNTDNDHLVKGTIRVEMPKEITSARQYSVRITQNNAVIGYLKMLDTNHPVSDYELEILKILGNYLPFAVSNIKTNFSDNNSLADELLLSLLELRVTDKQEIISRQELYNLKFYPYLYVISIHYTGSLSTRDIQDFTYRKVRSYFRNQLVTRTDGDFVILYDSNDSDIADSSVWTSAFSTFLEKENCIANISMPFTKLYEINNYYKQTKFCAEFRLLSKNSTSTTRKRLLFYRDIFEYHMILLLAREMNIADLLHPAVKILRNEKNSGGELLTTLFTYTRNHCSISDTAKILCLHYNTLKNRINRIEMLTGFTGEDSRDCFRIELSEKILEVLNFPGDDAEWLI